jgi:hypothetical protein
MLNMNMKMKAAAARAVFMVISRELRNSVDRASMLDTNTVNKQTSLPRAAAALNRYEAFNATWYRCTVRTKSNIALFELALIAT